MNTKSIGAVLTFGLCASAWAATPIEIPLGGTLVIDNFANADANSALGPWDIYPDASGKTTLDTSFVSNAGVNGTSNALRLNYYLEGYDILDYDPFVEAAVYVNKSSAAVDFSDCNEIQYEYRSNNEHSFRVIGDVDVASDYHHTMLDGEYTWQTATIHWNDLYQAGWGKPGDIDYVKKNLIAFSWQVQNDDGTEGYLEIANIRCMHKPAYMVSFYWGDSLLRSDEFFEGDWPNYNGSDEFSTEKYEYEIIGWTPERNYVTADASYHAVLDSSIRHYEVHFLNQFGDELMSQELEYGKTPAYVGLNPEKIPSVGYSYTFKGWGKRVCEEVEHSYCEDYGDGEEYCDTWVDTECTTTYEETLASVTEDTWYYPAYDSTANTYMVKFADYNGDPISEKMYTYGTKGVEIPATPTRAAAGDTTYTFKGWMPYIDEETEVEGNVVYVATYTATVTNGEDTEEVNLYTVTFVDGAEVLQTGEYASGEIPEYTGVTPFKDSTAEFVYTFADWRDPDGWRYGTHETYDNTIYLAIFDEQYRKYWIVFRNDDDSIIDSIQFDYGDEISSYYLRYKLKLKSTEDGYRQNYYGSAWTPELKRVTGRAEYKAVYNYRVRFADVDGRVIEERWLKKGETPDCKDCNVKRDPTAEYTYEFVGWNKEYAPVTDTTTYTAVYKAIPVPQSISQEIAEGESLLIDDFEDGDEMSALGTGWFVYNDSGAFDVEGGDTLYFNSQISKMVSLNGDKGNVLNVWYRRDCEEDRWDSEYCYGWLGVGVALAPEGQSLDLSQCNAIQYDYRGGAHNFRIQSVYDKDNQYLETRIGASDTMKTVLIYGSQFNRWYWDELVSPDVALSHATAFVWNNMRGSEGTLEIDNVRCLHKPSYTVKFYNGETLLDSAKYVEGVMPEYNGEKDLWSLEEVLENAQYSYSFKGWSPELDTVKADVSYQANFEKTVKTYEICFEGDKGYDFYGGCQEVEYGKVPVFEGDLTIEPDDYCEEYEFVKWTSCEEKYVEDGYYQTICTDGLVPVTGDRYYRADFDCKEPRMFTITFLNDNGDTLSSKKYTYRQSVYAPDANKTPTEAYYYKFDSWTPDFEWRAEGDVTYTAQYEEVPREYSVRFVNYWENTVYVDDEYEIDYSYGTSYSEIVLPTEELDEEQDDDTIFVFAGWDIDQNGDGIVTGDMVVKPKYNKKYAVRFESFESYGDGYGYSVIIPVNDEYEIYYPEGTPLSHILKPEDPTRDSWHNYETDTDVEYEFTGWLPTFGEDDVLTGPMTFSASYKTSDEKYTVTFMQDDEVIYQIDIPKDSVPEYSSNFGTPYKYETSEFTYTWDSEDGWEPALSAVTGPVVYKAKFKAVPRQYEVVFVTESGDTISHKKYNYGSTITDVPAKEIVVAGKTGEYEYSEDWCRLGTGWRPSENDDELWEEYKYIYCGNPGLEPVTEDVVYAPNIRYKVAFNDGDGNLMNDRYWSDFGWYRYGDMPEYYCEKGDCYEDEIPTKSSTVGYDYEWNGGWTPAFDTVKGSTGYTATFDSTLRKYVVAFEDEDGAVLLDTALYDYGTLVDAIALPSSPKKDPTLTTVYTFKGWSLKLVTGDVVYKASYEESPRKYLVTFVGDDGKTIIGTASYEYETAASIVQENAPVAPTKEGFKFTGWTPEIVAVTEEATYKANYVEDNKFVITWRNEDGTVLLQQTYTEGETPKYTGETPTKEPSVESTFAFDGWTPAVAAVDKDAEYTATYKTSVRKYIVKFVNYDGTLLRSSEYEYGKSAASITVPEVPERASTENYTYTFAGWQPAVGDVTGDVTYTALFGNEKRTYMVSFLKDDGSVWYAYRYYYNEVVEKPDWGPTKETPECYYEFAEWKRATGESDTVKSDMDYTVVYSTKCEERRYYVEFNDRIRDKQTWGNFAYGTKVSELNMPEVVEDTTIGDCSYHFIGWDPEPGDVTRDVEYRTKYEQTCKTQFEVVWHNYDGTTLKTEMYNKNARPKYEGETPVRVGSDKYTYRFSGWTPSLTEVIADAHYTAKYDSTYRMYDIVFVDRFNHEGFVDGEYTAAYRYGTLASAITVPTLEAVVTDNCTYSFNKWDKSIVDVTGYAVYVAEYDSVCKEPPPSSSSSSEVSSSSEAPKSSSSSEVSSSSEAPKSSSSSEKSSSSEAPKSSSSSVKSSSSEAPKSSSSSEKSSSSEAPKSSSSTVKSSSSEAPKSSSSSVKSSSSEAPKSSSSSVKSSSSKTPKSSSSEGSTIVRNNIQGGFKLAFNRNILTVALQTPSNVRIQVFDLNGQLMDGFDEYVSGFREFDLSQLEQGNYIVRIRNSSVQRTARILIK